jgi:hypothetical protein
MFCAGASHDGTVKRIMACCTNLAYYVRAQTILYGSDAVGIENRVADLRGVKCVYSVFGDFDSLVHICCAKTRILTMLSSISGK